MWGGGAEVEATAREFGVASDVDRVDKNVGNNSVDLSQYFISTNGIDADALLGDWRWLIGDGEYRLHKATAMGSLFLESPDGAIHFLDPTHAEFRRVAGSADELEELLADRQNRRDLLLSFFVRDLRERGVHLAPGKCYSWKVPLHLSGEPSTENIKPADLSIHVYVLGQLHEQTRRMKLGTVINEIRIVGPKPNLWQRVREWLSRGSVV